MCVRERTEEGGRKGGRCGRKLELLKYDLKCSEHV